MRILQSLNLENINGIQLWVNHQIRPWIFTGRPNSSFNYAKYQLSPLAMLICCPACSISDADLLPCMLCCLIHVARRKPRVQGLIWLNWKKIKFLLFSFFFFLLFPFCPCITHTSFLTFHSETSKTSLILLLPAKTFSILNLWSTRFDSTY